MKIFPPLKFSEFVGFLRQKRVTTSKAEHKLSQYSLENCLPLGNQCIFSMPAQVFLLLIQLSKSLFLFLPWIKYRCYVFIDFFIPLPGHVVGTFLNGSQHLVNCGGTRKACPLDGSRLPSRSQLGSVTIYHLSKKVSDQLQPTLKFLRDVGVRKLVYPALALSSW